MVLIFKGSRCSQCWRCQTVGVLRQISQFRLGLAKGRLPQAYRLILPSGARKAVKERAWRDDCEILPLNLGRGKKATITACADFVGTLGRNGARLFARMV